MVRERHQQANAKKLDNPDEMDKLIETHKLPKLTPEEIENLNRPATSKEIKLVIKNKIRVIQTGNNGVKLSVHTGDTFSYLKKKSLGIYKRINR